jgi:hypothetical protein
MYGAGFIDDSSFLKKAKRAKRKGERKNDRYAMREDEKAWRDGSVRGNRRDFSKRVRESSGARGCTKRGY